jgi:hypothetical protein
MRDDARGHAAFGKGFDFIESFVLQFPRLHVNMSRSPFHLSFVKANILVWRRTLAGDGGTDQIPPKASCHESSRYGRHNDL